MFKNSEMREMLQEINEFIEQEKKEGGIFENVEEYAKKRLLFDDQTAKKYAENFNNQITDKVLNHRGYIRATYFENMEKYEETGKAAGIIMGDQFAKLGIILNTKEIEKCVSKKLFSEDFLLELLKKLGHDIRSQMIQTKYNNMPIDMIGQYILEAKNKTYIIIVDKIAVLIISVFSSRNNTQMYENYEYENYLLWGRDFTFEFS